MVGVLFLQVLLDRPQQGAVAYLLEENRVLRGVSYVGGVFACAMTTGARDTIDREAYGRTAPKLERSATSQ